MSGPLTLDGVPDELLAECDLRPGGATSEAYRCTDRAAVLAPLAVVCGPQARLLNRERLVKILRGFRDGADLPPVVAYAEATAGAIELLQGVHRWRASLAYGFTYIPCVLVSLTEALEAGYKPR